MTCNPPVSLRSATTSLLTAMLRALQQAAGWEKTRQVTDEGLLATDVSSAAHGANLVHRGV